MRAEDILVFGDRIRITPGKSLRAQVSGPVVLPGPADDPTVHGGWLTVFDTALDGAGEAVFELEAGGWKGLGKPPGKKGFHFSGGACKKVRVTPGQITIACDGGVTLSPPFVGDVGLILELGAETVRYCAQFGGSMLKNSAARVSALGAGLPAGCSAIGQTPTPTLPRFPLPTFTFTLTPLPGTPTHTPTRTPSGTPTNALPPPTLTFTLTPAFTATDTPTHTPTFTFTTTPTLMSTETPTFTPNNTPTNTLPPPTLTFTLTPTLTLTDTPTHTPTFTFTSTPTLTLTGTETPMFTPSSTPTNTLPPPTCSATPAPTCGGVCHAAGRVCTDMGGFCACQ